MAKRRHESGESRSKSNRKNDPTAITGLTGHVKWFDRKKGYGFIELTDSTQDVFVHISAVKAADLDTLVEDQILAFDLKVGRNEKYQACNLKLIGEIVETQKRRSSDRVPYFFGTVKWFDESKGSCLVILVMNKEVVFVPPWSVKKSGLAEKLIRGAAVACELSPKSKSGRRRSVKTIQARI